MHFNFCYVREMGERPRAHWRKEADVRVVFSQTTLANHYTVSHRVVDGAPRDHFVNHGIDPARVSTLRGRPVETMRIEEMRSPGPKNSHERLNTHTKTLEVYRPRLPDRGRHQP